MFSCIWKSYLVISHMNVCYEYFKMFSWSDRITRPEVDGVILCPSTFPHSHNSSWRFPRIYFFYSLSRLLMEVLQGLKNQTACFLNLRLNELWGHHRSPDGSFKWLFRYQKLHSMICFGECVYGYTRSSVALSEPFETSVQFVRQSFVINEDIN